MTLLPSRACLSALALAVALVPVAAKPADAATKKHHRHHHAARTVAKKAVHPQRAAAESVTPAPAPAPAAPTVTSVISIGGYVFYNLSYAQAVEAYQALVAAAPAGSTPPPVTSVSVTTTVGGSASVRGRPGRSAERAADQPVVAEPSAARPRTTFRISTGRPPSASTPRRLAGLDGVRGLAALFVVINHIFERAFPRLSGRPGAVLGGLVHLRPVRRRRVHRAVRLLARAVAGPPRLAARRRGPVRAAPGLADPAAVLGRPGVQPHRGVARRPAAGQGAPERKSVAVNGLLCRTSSARPPPTGAFWSLAIEAQLYVVFPLLLLRSAGSGAVAMVAAVTLAVATVGVWARTSPRSLMLQSSPDLAALFALGVAAAGIVPATLPAGPRRGPGSHSPRPSRGRDDRWPGSVRTLDHLFWVDLALGPAIGCLLAALAPVARGLAPGLLDTRPLRRLGAYSYSLYLTHFPIVVACTTGRGGPVPPGRAGVPSSRRPWSLPLTIAFAHVFASVFETPFRRRLASSRNREAVAGVAS